MLTVPQAQLLAAGLRAETNQTVVDALAARDDYTLSLWVNTNSIQDAWNAAMQKRDLFEATDITSFDTVTAGKREAWGLMLDNAPLDMSRNKLRKAVVDVWGSTTGVTVLQACLRKATNGEVYIGGTSQTTQTVAGLNLKYAGPISINDISNALNNF